jgi:hypothetical protein
VPGFTPLAESEVGHAAWRLGQPFAEAVFDGRTPAQLAAVPLEPGAGPLVDAPVTEMAFPWEQPRCSSSSGPACTGW